MKLFSNFDTKRMEKILQEQQEEFWEDNVLLVQKSYLFRLIYIVAPMLSYLIIVSSLILLVINFIENEHLLILIIWFIGLVSITIVWPVLRNYLAYKMDFLIITPKSVTKVDQEWLFERDVQTLSTQNIRTISVKKNWIIRSIFNNGDMIFLSEASDEQDVGKILCRYVNKPEKVRHKIASIIRKTDSFK